MAAKGYSIINRKRTAVLQGLRCILRGCPFSCVKGFDTLLAVQTNSLPAIKLADPGTADISVVRGGTVVRRGEGGVSD